MDVRATFSGNPSQPNPAAVRDILLREGLVGLNRAMTMVAAETIRRAPHRTGHFRRSIHGHAIVEGATIVGIVGSSVFYGPYLEFGTGLYGPRNQWIVPKQGRFLRFPAGGSASLFSGGERAGGSAGAGFTLAGRQRSGSGGAGARWVYARRVRGIRPRHTFRDSALITKPRVEREMLMASRRAAEQIAGLMA